MKMTCSFNREYFNDVYNGDLFKIAVDLRHLIHIPKKFLEVCNFKANETVITTRTGYFRCNLPISLFKQFCIAYEINDNVFFCNMFHSDFKETLEEYCNGEMKVFLFMLDKHFEIYAMRTINKISVASEFNLIETFQMQLAKKLNRSTKGYSAFFSFVTTDELRTKIQEDFYNVLD